MAPGEISSAALSRKKTVSTTSSPRSWAISSRPVASGIPNDFLGAARLVAVAPAHRRVVLDHLAQLEDPVRERLGPRRAAGHVHVDWHELVGRHDRVVVEDAHARRAGAHRDRPLRLEHLVVDAPDDRRHLDADAAAEDQQVGLARGGAECLEPETRDVHARGDDRHHLDRAAGKAERRREHRVAARPADGLVERRRDHALLDVLLERVALQVTAQHVARPQLADAEVVGRRGGHRFAADYLHSSAPLRQTYTNATSSSAMKTTVSTIANVPKDRSCTATG